MVLNRRRLPTIHCNSMRCRVRTRWQLTAVDLLAVWRNSLYTVAKPCSVMAVCQTLSPIRFANASKIRRVRNKAFFSHCEINVTSILSQRQFFHFIKHRIQHLIIHKIIQTHLPKILFTHIIFSTDKSQRQHNSVFN